ncbi:M3 family oligoendopeptidase [Virgibacillus sp. YIM 98842]|uniref:M3 family oligoendopeptidase n=1 Tax=Virgibacillus sp. YIM 98842 TaxID=2663533 RepID=UPI0013DBA2FA|nr:M3 family oligoendopeptidase [Virgibacillus sp. YIM 98842]
MQKTYDPTWDLDILFPGGSESKAFHTYLSDIEKEIVKLTAEVDSYSPEQPNGMTGLENIVEHMEKITKKAREAFAFISCLSAQDVNDTKASLLVGKRSEIKAKLDAIQTNLEQKFIQIDEAAWSDMLKSDALQEVSFVLNENRERAEERLSVDEEVLINDLEVDGYHGWGQMYDTIVGDMQVELEEHGKTNVYSVGQAANKIVNPDRNIRKHVFSQISKAWKENADLFGQTLNHLAGFRLQKYRHRGWDDVLKEPLAINRMQKETLDAMWKAITNNKQYFVEFLNKKAELLGIEKLSMYDISAPVSESVKKMPYTQGADFIIEQFGKFSPKMADFAKMAFEKRWIEAEDRAGKRPGGFCTSFPDSEQTRIFMTYSGTSSNIATLAHELGHAYHQHVMNDVNGLNQRYAMNVAETASTFAEMIVADAAVKNARNAEEKLALLEDKIQRSVAFFMNIHARFLFETWFYEERKQGLVPVDRLNELMVEAQKEAYCDALEEYDENFWSSKLHFHITGVPFYNFPYTFGYLFSLGIYAAAKEQGDDFEDDYIALLRDTGKMNVEELADKHLHVDLTKPEFWESALKLCIADVKEFLTLAD